MTFPPLSPDQPASAVQLGAALAALGLYGGTNTAAEHAAEAARLGGPDPYRMRLANALLGAVQVEAMLAETGAAGAEGLAAAHREQLVTTGVVDDAEKHSTSMEADRLHGVYVDAREGRVKLKDYGETKWLPSQVHLREGSASTYDTHLRSRIYPALGERRVNGITRSDMKAFVAGLVASDLKPSTIHTIFAVVRALMQSAVDDGVIPANPCSRAPLPRVEPRVVEPLPVAAVLALAETITPRYKLAVWLGAGLGLREGEALGLTVGKVGFLRRRVHIHQQMQRGQLAPLKTKASKRTIPVDDVVLAEITAHMQRFEPGAGDVLIINRCRRPVKRSSFWTCWAEAVEGVGLPKGTRLLSRPEARCRDCSRSVSPGRSPNPPCRSLG
ncbi:tyrosine-type recombinase/integrase, partial [Streptosporangium amethystogenes]|uniref:tyrosine-type recombinase/integrase n=1 Tax=Streptosporangium amethystogenes TaxID=2002 RepID=UPI0037A13C53